jgi:outer membrane protein assembly factor BamE (lipoprotein component of BamABCDE complex)
MRRGDDSNAALATRVRGRVAAASSVRAVIRGVLVVAIATTLAACASKWRENEGLISTGMSREEVVELLGEPSSKVEVPAWGDRPAFARWQWNDNLSTLATGAMFPDTVPDRVLAVSFDAEGRVTEVVLPRTPNP